ncbi:MAG: phosphoglucosamine mutase [Haloferacaceae archaeon]
MELFGSSGTRGTVGEAMTPSLVLRVARAAGTVWGADEAAVARDTRTSGAMLAAAAASGLASVGTDAVLLGPVPTPGVAAHCEREGMPALVVTASHNPPAYNGVKLLGADGVELTVEALERVERRVFTEPVAEAAWDGVGDLRRVADANERYVTDLLDAADRDRIADAGLTVAVDPGHGAGALTSPEFFRRLGCEVVTANAQPDGHFPGRDPEPVPGNLGDLRRLVRAADADLGVAHDGDADRAIFVDETGETVPGEASLAALVAAELDPGDAVVAAVNASQRLVDVVEAADARLELTPIGATNIVTRIRDLRADGVSVPVAGEGNGGVYFPEYRLSRDGAHTAARFLELVAERPASAVVEPHLDYHFVRRSVEHGSERERERLLAAAAEYAADAPVDPDTTDGYRLDFGDAWVLVRPSGTEPKVRVYAEARDPDRADRLADDLVSALEAAR